MKTAISIPQELFLAVNELTARLHLSRSKIITAAIQDYVTKQKNRELLKSLNDVYSGITTKEEIDLKTQSTISYYKLLEEDKW